MMDDVETTPLVSKEVSSPSSFPWKKLGVACVGALALTSAVEYTRSTWSPNPTDLHSDVEFKKYTPGAGEDGWYIYKVAYVGKSGETETLLRFLTDHSGGQDCEAVNLGCEGYKLTCTFKDKQIHYVVAPALKSEAVDGDGMGVDGWNELSMASLDMESWSPFMHDKLQLYIKDVVSKGLELEASGHTVLRRQSAHVETNDEGVDKTFTIGHVMVAIGGKVWDFVGELDSVEAASKEGFDLFLESECGKASKLSSNYKMKELRVLAKAHASSLLSIQSAASSLENKGIVQVTSLLKAMTGAIVEVEKDAESCDVMSVHYFNEWEEEEGGSSGAQLYMKYVVNHNFQNFKNSDLTVKDYEDYIYKVHDRYLSKPEDHDMAHRWRNWDHWLDMHIGVKYAGNTLLSTSTEATKGPAAGAPPPMFAPDSLTTTTTTSVSDELQDSCLLAGKQLNEYLIDEHIDVGKRFILTDGDHYYCGFEGSSMTVEFNTECHYGNEGATDICTCNVMNSDNLALEHYDAAFSSCQDIYTEMDGHDDTTVTRDTGSSFGTGGDKPN